MAPDTVAGLLADLPRDSQVLDPMCGSGVVIRQSLLFGHRAMGFDIDPLAVLMSTVWTRRARYETFSERANALVKAAGKLKITYTDLPWVAGCEETKAFIEYWFVEPQISQLSKLAWLIHRNSSGWSDSSLNALKLGLSRTIVTKHVGASLAWDVSHSRPHRKREENDFDVFDGFLKAVGRIRSALESDLVPENGQVRRGDSRKLSKVAKNSIDAVVTSPPYLNAIDYMRGHKLALIWLGYTIPELRALRSGSIGAEKGADRDLVANAVAQSIEDKLPKLKLLPSRHLSMVHRYACDASLMLCESRRVLKKGGRLVLVLGDSTLRGVSVSNSKIFSHLASGLGFELLSETKRELVNSRRYLPMPEEQSNLAKRMRHEIIQVYRAAA